MRILFLAPQPFYQQRGTPIAVKLLLEELGQRGDIVDVLTYHEGENVMIENITLHRIPDLKFIRNIRPGFSLKKLICDVLMAVQAVRMCMSHHYTIVHAVEEAAFIALFIKLIWGVPYIYDMDSSLPEQIVAKQPGLSFLVPLMRRFERVIVKGALVVVPVCDALRDTVQVYACKHVVVLYDVPLSREDSLDVGRWEELRESTDDCLVVYVGNLEPYQGIDLLLESFAIAQRQTPNLQLIIIGGRSDDIANYRMKSDDLGTAENVHFLGPRPVEKLASYLAQADILASPRISGSNTPMKIYSYLESGKPILATNLSTHTQVLDSRSALLTEPTPQAYGDGLVRLAQDNSLCAALGEVGRQYARDKYSFVRFQQTFSALMNTVQEEVTAAI